MFVNTKRYLLFLMTILMVSFFVSCSSDTDDSSTTEPDPNTGIVQLTIDASSYTNWTYFNVSSGEIVSPVEPENSTEWDLAFNRFKIKTNSGTSGIGDAGIIDLGVQEFDSVASVPSNYYFVDDSLAINMGDSLASESHYSFNKLFYDWYSMEGSPPSITILSRDHIYSVKNASGSVYSKLQILDYYDPISSQSGFLTIKYVDSMIVNTENFTNTIEVVINATDSLNWVYYNFQNSEVVEIDDPLLSNEWDIAFQKYRIKTNSGTAQSTYTVDVGLGVHILDTVLPFEEIRTVSTDLNYTVDTELVDQADSTFIYDGNSLMYDWFLFQEDPPITNYDRIYIIQDGRFDYTKLQLLEYTGGIVKFKYEYYITADWE